MISRLYIKLILCLNFLIALQISASCMDECNEGCNEDCSSNRIAFQLEYLYFQPLVDNTFFAMPDKNGTVPFNLTPAGSRKKNKFDYESGFRISALYDIQDCDSCISRIGLCFTYLPAEHHRRVNSNDYPFVTVGAPELIDALAFYRAELLVLSHPNIVSIIMQPIYT